jgi:hypothetical protein
MRANVMTAFYETLDYCFEQALRDILGSSVEDSVYALLDRNKIARKDVSNRFDEVVAVMLKSLGTCSRVIVQRTVTEMYNQYSQRINFTYLDSLKEQLTSLRESVVANHLAPRRSWQNINYDTLERLDLSFGRNSVGTRNAE